MPYAAEIAFLALGVNLLGGVVLLMFNPGHRAMRWYVATLVSVIGWLFAQGMGFASGHWPVWRPVMMAAALSIPVFFLMTALADAGLSGRRRQLAWLGAAGLPLPAALVGLAAAAQPAWMHALIVLWQTTLWVLAGRVIWRRRRLDLPQRFRGPLTIALAIVLPASVAVGWLIGWPFFVYAMPLITVAWQVVQFAAVLHLRHYDIEIRVSRSGDIVTGLARQERLAVLGEVAASLAHEVRNPLTGIRSLAQQIAQDRIGDADRRRYAGVIMTEADRVQRIVSNLLGIARQETPGPQAEATTVLDPLFQDLLLLVGGRARSAGVNVVADAGGTTAPAPREPLAQALLNLLLNAIDHAPPGGRVELLARRRDGEVEVLVRDDGAGIPAAERRRIFEPFHSGSGGTGLGLAVVRRLAQDLGWSLVVDDAPAGGAEFRIRIPEPAPGRRPRPRAAMPGVT